MNKKRLSVVMAGAMLASSVAPVLAAETHQTTHGNMGLFINDLEVLMETKKYHITDTQEAGKSVYRFQILDSKGNPKDNLSTNYRDQYTVDGKQIYLYNSPVLLKKLNAKENYTVKVYELGSVEKDGNYFSIASKEEGKEIAYNTTTFGDLVSDAKLVSKESTATAKANAIKTNGKYKGLVAAFNEGWIVDLSVDEKETKVTVTLGSKTGNEFNTIECTVGSPKLSFANPVDAKGNVLANASTSGNYEANYVNPTVINKEYVQDNIAGFKIARDADATNVDVRGKNAKLSYEVNVLNGDVLHEVNLDDLYDGFMLTDKGHELMNAVRAYDAAEKKSKSVGKVEEGKGTEHYLDVTLHNDVTDTDIVVRIKSNSSKIKRLETLKTWYTNMVADVELLAGDNRYATAVEIAETYLAGQYVNNGTLAKPNREIVLINGKALVDGLAAAPYARQQEAPILLTAEDKLPKETKDYLRKLIKKHTVGNLDKLTITIVGGESVVSNSVVRELEDIGFTVRRISGDNREETSLAVADKLKTTNKAYVVGAEGEADAMSIAAHAAQEGSAIIVSKSVKGLSTVGINEVADFKDVEIVGGEGVVPKSTEESLTKLVGEDHISRINGKNRFETNALVIKKYHQKFANALIAKDGQRNKEELVDALPASLFASTTASTSNGVAAPIVLATDKISKEQLNQLVLNVDKTKTNRTVYQIGNGVNPKTVMQVVVTKLGLNR